MIRVMNSRTSVTYNTDGGDGHERRRPLEILGCRWNDNIKMKLKEIECENVDWVKLAQDRGQWDQ
jgi:hypothetical protein